MGLGLVLLLVYDSWAALAVAVALYGLAYVFLRRCLQAFPWGLDLDSDEPTTETPVVRPTLQDQSKPMPWPLDVLRPRDPAPAIAVRGALQIACLVAWYQFVVAQLVAVSDQFILLGIAVGAVLAFAPLGRLGAYANKHESPLGLWARLFTGRWIIPGYDRIWIAPICSGLAGVVMLAWLWLLGMPSDVSCPLASAATVLVALTMPPTLGEWQLTGGFRLSGPPPRSAVYERI